MPDHAHQRRDPRAGAHQQHRAAIAGAPDEVSADRAAQLDLVAQRRHVVEEGGDLAVVQAFDGQFDAARLLRRGGDGVAALGLVAVRRGQAHVHVLAGLEGERRGGGEDEAGHPVRSLDDLDDGRLPPQQTRGGGAGKGLGVSHR